MISYILAMAFSALGLDEVSTKVRRRRDKDYLTFWRRWREFANKLVRKGMAHTETKHCTTIQNKYYIQCVSQHTRLWLYSGKSVGLTNPQREHFAGIRLWEHFAGISIEQQIYRKLIYPTYPTHLLISPTHPILPSILIYLLYFPYPMMPLMLSHGAINLDDLSGDIGR